jgi:hypothetical protein
LGDLAYFLDTATRHGRTTEPLWKAIEKEPDKLADRALATPLGELAAFLDTAMRYGRKMEPLWEAIEREPDKLAARAWETPLNDIAHFQSVAKEQGREIEALWEALQQRPARLSALARACSLANLVGFIRYAPDSLVKTALVDVKANIWDDIHNSEPLTGATWLAYRCMQVDREDLKVAIITALLRRANPEDFPKQQGKALSGVAWLLANVPPAASALITRFLDGLCTNRWLGYQYTNITCGPLAEGMRLLALHQPLQIRRRFYNPSLGIRLQNEISRFAEVIPEGQSLIIQFLGCATLFGWSVRRDWFNGLPLDAVAALSTETLPHRAEAVRVEAWQFQLWLGLRAVVSITGKPLAVPAAIIERTLELWRSNLAESSINEGSTEHRVNRSMVAWLEMCLRGGQGLVAR